MLKNEQEAKLSKKILDFHQVNYRKPETHQAVLDPKASYFQYSRYYAILKEIGSLEFDSFLDMGCSEGMYLNGVKKAAPKCNVYGVDFSSIALKKAQTYSNQAEPFLVCADGTHLPFKEKGFDIVLCSETLEHMVDDKAAIKELARICRKTCIVTVPSFHSKRSKTSFHPDFDCAHDSHLRKYLRKDLENLLRQWFHAVTIYDLSFWFLSSADIVLHSSLPRNISPKLSHALGALAGLDYSLCKAGAHGHSFICICQKEASES